MVKGLGSGAAYMGSFFAIVFAVTALAALHVIPAENDIQNLAMAIRIIPIASLLLPALMGSLSELRVGNLLTSLNLNPDFCSSWKTNRLRFQLIKWIFICSICWLWITIRVN